MLDALDTSSGIGALSALSKKREQNAAERAQAMSLGRGVENQEQLEKKVREVAEDFVSVFMNQVMKSMRATVHETPEMHGDNGEKFFQDLLDTEYSKSLSKGSGYGLTDLIYESMMTSYRVTRPEEAAGQADSFENMGEPAESDLLAVGEIS